MAGTVKIINPTSEDLVLCFGVYDPDDVDELIWSAENFTLPAGGEKVFNDVAEYDWEESEGSDAPFLTEKDWEDGVLFSPFKISIKDGETTIIKVGRE